MTLKPDPKEMMLKVADQIALLHESHWMDTEFAKNSKSFLANADFFFGENRERFESLKSLFGRFLCISKCLRPQLRKQYPFCVRLAEQAFKNFTWENYQAMISKDKVFCVCHGDLHLQNILWNDVEKSVYLIDYEFSSIHYPCHDLGLFYTKLPRTLRKYFDEFFLPRYYE